MIETLRETKKKGSLFMTFTNSIDTVVVLWSGSERERHLTTNIELFYDSRLFNNFILLRYIGIFREVSIHEGIEFLKKELHNCAQLERDDVADPSGYFPNTKKGPGGRTC